MSGVLWLGGLTCPGGSANKFSPVSSPRGRHPCWTPPLSSHTAGHCPERATTGGTVTLKAQVTVPSHLPGGLSQERLYLAFLVLVKPGCPYTAGLNQPGVQVPRPQGSSTQGKPLPVHLQLRVRTGSDTPTFLGHPQACHQTLHKVQMEGDSHSRQPTAKRVAFSGFLQEWSGQVVEQI